MKYEHPTISIERSAPGHYIIRGHAPQPVLTEHGHLVPPPECYLAPEIPREALLAILEDRGELAGGGVGGGEHGTYRTNRTYTTYGAETAPIGEGPANAAPTGDTPAGDTLAGDTLAGDT